MIYFDTDVLINYFIEQDLNKNQQAVRLFQEATKDGQFFCSLLCMQELSFVLSKLKVSNELIENLTAELLTPLTVSYTIEYYRRAV